MPQWWGGFGEKVVMNEVRILMLLCLMIGAVLLTGCGVLTGIKRIQSGDTTIEFATGIDFSASANGIDTVNNQRGIRPEVRNAGR